MNPIPEPLPCVPPACLGHSSTLNMSSLFVGWQQDQLQEAGCPAALH